MLRALRLRPPPCMFTTPKPLCFGATTLSLPPQSFTATHAIAFHLRTVPFNSAVLASTVVLLGSAASEDSLADRQEMRWLRCARAARIVKLSQLSPSLLKMMQTLLYASNSIINITIGIALFTFAYAQFGMSVLGTLLYDHEGVGVSRHANFETASRSFSALVRMSTGDSWTAMLADAVHNPHVPGVEPPPTALIYFYFLFYMGFMGWVLVSIFVAVILDYFNDSDSKMAIDIKFDDIESFQRKWLEFDVSSTSSIPILAFTLTHTPTFARAQVRSTSYIRTVDLGLLLYACKPPLVGVQLEQRDGLFFAGSQLVRPNLTQLEAMLVELDIPEHDGSVHFLEVLLALLQRLTGVIHEEQMMAQLLALHPKYVDSVKKMPAITGSTADAFVRDSIMQHLRRGLKATGLLELEEAASSFTCPNRGGGSSSGLAGGRRGSVCVAALEQARSFTRRRSVAPNSPEAIMMREAAQQAKVARINDMRREALARVATTNATGMRAAAALAGSFNNSFKQRGDNSPAGSSFGRTISAGSSFGRAMSTGPQGANQAGISVLKRAGGSVQPARRDLLSPSKDPLAC